MQPSNAHNRAASGIVGLDDILGGGFPKNRLYLIEGNPGVGKTTLALQFLLEGVRQGERALYVTLSETEEELRAVAASHNWALDPIKIYEMSEALRSAHEDDNTLYVPAEVELGERMKHLLKVVDEVNPTRIVLDSCSELRLLAQSQLRFRRQLLALKEDLVRRNSTILLLENPTNQEGDLLLQSLVHGVVQIEQLSPLYGAERRRLRIVKMREVAFLGGYHDTVIRKGGLVVFPRLVAAEHHENFTNETVSSNIPGLDRLLGGGLDRGTSVLLLGPAGTGKSALVSHYAAAMADRGEHVAIFAFDEGLNTFCTRARRIGLDLDKHFASGAVTVQQVDPAELSPGEFVHIVRQAVDEHNARMVVIDSINGYMQSMLEEQFLNVQLHELLSYLRQRGVLLLMVVAQQGILPNIPSSIEVTYLADTVILMRYFEAGGRLRKALSVIKKRSGPHEDTVREFSLGENGFNVGPPLEQFRGVLLGVPVLDSEPVR